MPARLFALLAILGSLAGLLPAQDPPAMLATARYLFVLRGDTLYQFDVDTLELRHTATLGGRPAPAVAPPARRPLAQATPAQPAPDAGDAGRAVELGLAWLARHQDDNGKWDADGFMKHDKEGAPCDGPGNPVHDVGATGLAMLAMLGSGSTLRSGPHRDHLKRAAGWLREQQQENGLYGVNASHDFIYDHAIAAFAMSEAQGLSQYAVLKPTAQKGLDYLESHRNPYAVWRYQPRDNDNDTSVTTWCVTALCSGESHGLEINPNAKKLALTWLDQVTGEDGRHGYSKRGEPSSRHPGDHATRFPVTSTEALTAAGLWCRFLLGQDPKDTPIMKVAAARLLAKPPQWDVEGGATDFYYWYFGTLACQQMGGRFWQEWQAALRPALAQAQRQDGNFRGSFDPKSAWCQDGGRVYATALGVLCHEVVARVAKLRK